MRTAQSSLAKGESLVDTAMTLGAMQPDVLVIRHAEAGVPHDIAALDEEGIDVQPRPLGGVQSAHHQSLPS